jgi:hypothetical protein
VDQAGSARGARWDVDSDELNEGNLHADLGQIVAGLKPGAKAITRPSYSGIED